MKQIHFSVFLFSIIYFPIYTHGEKENIKFVVLLSLAMKEILLPLVLNQMKNSMRKH